MKALLRLGLVAGAMAAPVYSMVRYLAESLGLHFFPMMLPIPDTLEEAWVVIPGAIVLGILLEAVLEQVARPNRLLMGGMLGALMGLANIPISVLVALAAWHAQTPWRYGFGALLDEWTKNLVFMLVKGAPVGLVTGLILGAFQGMVSGCLPLEGGRKGGLDV